jgi:tetratricopeptide (TPR) repeat protein
MTVPEATSRVRAVAQEVLGHENVEDVCFFLGQLMGLPFDESPLTLAATDDAAQAQGLRAAVVRRFFEADSVRVPLCLVFDDLHFADADSLDLLQSLIENLDGRILLICAGGRELLASREAWGNSSTGRHHSIELEPLNQQTTSELIRRMLRRCENGVPQALVDAAVKASGGNPGQMSQMVRSYFESGVLEASDDPRQPWRVNLERLSSVRLPMSVEDAVALRISALTGVERRVLEHAAAMGSVFWLGGLVALGRMDREVPEFWSEREPADIRRLEDVLERLVERDYLLSLEATVFSDEQEFVFKHNFEREKIAALTSATLARRYQQTIADWFAQKSTARSREEYTARLASHLSKAGSQTRAGFTYLDAGDLARKSFALRKASEYYGNGLRLLGDDDARRRVDALHNHGDVLALLGKTDEAMESFRQMLSIAYQLNLVGKGGAAHNRMGRLYRETGFLTEANQHLHAARELFLAAGDNRGVAASHDDIGKLLWVRGDYDDALQEMRTALDMRRELGDRRSIALSLNNIGLVWMDHGRPTNAKDALEAALKIRREINDPVGVADSLNTLGSLNVDQNKFEAALECFREAHDVLVAIGERTRIAGCLTQIGQTLERLGQGKEAVRILREAVTLCEEIGDKLQLAEARRGLAKSHLLAGDLKLARREVREAVDLFAEVRSKPHLAIALRTLGEVTGAGAWGQKHEGRAVEYFMRSIAIAKEIGNEVEVARSYMAFSTYVTRSYGYETNSEIQREAVKLKEMADEIFERHRISVEL